MTRNYLPKKIELSLIALVFFISIFALLGWILDQPKIIFLLSASSTMKANTAISMLLITTAIFLYHKRNKALKTIKYSCLIIVLFISASTLYGYLIGDSLFIDNFFISDNYSENHAGRMSRATDICFLFFSIGLIGVSLKNRIIRYSFHFFFVAVLILGFISMVSHLLSVPIEHKITFFQTMAVQTSVCFVILSLIVLLKRSVFSFGDFFLGGYAGSRLVRIMLPFLVIMPIAINYLLIQIAQEDWFEIDFGISVSAVVYILLSIGYVTYFGDRLNKINQQSRELTRALNRNKQNELKINLLRETHHRVKNNFQMVNSVLRLQALKFDDEKLLSALEDSQDRIRAMALLHEQMYREGNYEQVEVDSFFKAIISPLVSAYAIDRELELVYEVRPKLMEMNLAIPLGLVINEMVTNSLKHAFEGRTGGKIIIQLFDYDLEHYSLIIGDDGIGLDENKINIKADDQSMGQELISIFCEQINARKTRLDCPGTQYQIIFPKHPYA